MARQRVLLWSSVLILCLCSFAAGDVVIFIDYSQDTNNFFSSQARRDALQSAADRWGRILNSNLGAVGPGGTVTGTSAGWRVGFSHPGTGNSFQISTATSSATDPLIGAGAANVYGFSGLQANTWILYAGGRDLGGTAGVGGSGTGTNFTTTFTDANGPFHRGVMAVGSSMPQNDIPIWGGSVSFNNTLTWHFDPATPATSGETDFYSIALHEIGHALGLSVGFNQWQNFVTGSVFNGPNAVAAYNADNNTNLSSLNMVSNTNLHWLDNTYDAKIFPGAGPNYVGTVGAGNLQDLLMEPIADFTQSVNRFEVTTVEVGALRDLGWIVVGVPEVSTVLYLGGILTIGGYLYARRKTKVDAASCRVAEDGNATE